MVYQDTITINTSGNGDLHDLSDQVTSIVNKSGVKMGIASIFNVGSTAAISTIEFESGLKKDLPEMLNRLIPASREYGHEKAWHDGNGHSHLQATTLGPSLQIPVRNGNPVLGTWQQVIHIECDNKPRQRSIVVTVIGE
ncbi:MAG TPA: secondary thiamine-phosphate synthase enzyme YjbQ [Balneolales bacterium]|nr:secondary thiamine-phosphate synthase enzyme YjbQ [Balneolales bacterium]